MTVKHNLSKNMDDESKIVQQEATISDEELELDLNLDDTEDVGTQAQDTVSKDKFRQVLARAKKAEEALKKQKSVEKPQIINNVEEKKVDPLAIIRDESFKLFREGYDEDDIELILKNGGRKILSDEKNPITLGLRAKREQLEAEKAASMTNNSSSLSEVERKFTPEQLEKMPLDKLEETLRNAG